MSRIVADARTVESILSKKYKIDPYQREYKWETSNITDLLEDLGGTFLENYREGHKRPDVERYGHYFLGSIVVCNKNGDNFIVDGQQRLISLTLLLIHLDHIQKDPSNRVSLEHLIASEKYGERTPNIRMEGRTQCLKALYERQEVDIKGESAKNIMQRYDDIEQNLPLELRERALPYFIDWILNKVQLVQITTYTSMDAYAIFETINDRGLSLTPTDMLKGYLLTRIENQKELDRANTTWKKQILALFDVDGNTYPYFFKSWLRAKHAKSARERKRGATNKDYEQIGSSFHKWVREKGRSIGLTSPDDFRDFIEKEFVFFANKYIEMRKAADVFNPELEYIYYNDVNNFTLQYPLMMAPLQIQDSPDTVLRKFRLVSMYVDMFIAHRGMNRQKWGYSSVYYSMFRLMRDIRDLDIKDLAKELKQRVDRMDDKFQDFDIFRLHQQNRRFVRYFLARITRYIEDQCDLDSNFDGYMYGVKGNPSEIEHIIPDKWERYHNVFDDKEEFERLRNRIGALLLLPKSFNQSYGAKEYQVKVEKYYSQNLLAQSLSTKCYDGHPKFRKYRERSGLPFRPHEEFTKDDIKSRHNLYQKIAEQVWSPELLDAETEGL